jgi:hypothetical protein
MGWGLGERRVLRARKRGRDTRRDFDHAVAQSALDIGCASHLKRSRQ